jgi:hypothetical protein
MPRSKASAQIARARKALQQLRLPRIGRPRRPKLQDLINLESELGRVVFGRLPAGARREFFYHGNNLWIFHEERLGEAPLTISYEVRADEVLKILPDRTSVAITGDELDNFLAAARTYHLLIREYIYESADA